MSSENDNDMDVDVSHGDEYELHGHNHEPLNSEQTKDPIPNSNVWNADSSLETSDDTGIDRGRIIDDLSRA